jgi:hypothetical protein
MNCDDFTPRLHWPNLPIPPPPWVTQAHACSVQAHIPAKETLQHISTPKKKRLCMPCKASYIASISQLLCSVVLCIICGRLTHVPITHWTRSTVAAARTLRTCATPHHFTSKPYRAVVAFRAIAHRSLGFTRACHSSPLHVSRAWHSLYCVHAEPEVHLSNLILQPSHPHNCIR